jgi:hypothetical protein
MKTERKKTEPPKFLSGWKDIANYLGKGVRTVQRYESELGLPVRRPAGKPRGSVVATRPELDAWVSASPIREAFRLSRPPLDHDAPTAAAIKNRIDEMRRLSGQMLALRAELRGSVSLLRESIQSLRGELSRGRATHDQWRDTDPLPALERGARPNSVFDFFAAHSKLPKAG